MKTTGITRKIDELGRIVLPIELRKQFGIDVKDLIEIYVDGDRIILRKKKDACIFCSSLYRDRCSWHLAPQRQHGKRCGEPRIFRCAYHAAYDGLRRVF